MNLDPMTLMLMAQMSDENNFSSVLPWLMFKGYSDSDMNPTSQMMMAYMISNLKSKGCKKNDSKNILINRDSFLYAYDGNFQNVTNIEKMLEYVERNEKTIKPEFQFILKNLNKDDIIGLNLRKKIENIIDLNVFKEYFVYTDNNFVIDINSEVFTFERSKEFLLVNKALNECEILVNKAMKDCENYLKELMPNKTTTDTMELDKLYELAYTKPDELDELCELAQTKPDEEKETKTD